MADTSAGWMSRLSIQHRMLLAFGSLMLMLVVVCSAFLWAQGQESSGRGWISHTYQVILELHGIESAIGDQRLALRDYLIENGTNDGLSAYAEGRKAFSQHLAQLQKLTEDNPVQQARAVQLESVMTRWTDKYATPERELGARRETRAAAEALLSLPDNHALMGQIIGLIDSMEQTERTLLLQRTTRLERSMLLARWGAVVLLLVGLLAGWMILRMSSRSITAPIRRMTELMTRLARDDHSIEVPYRQRGDEIGLIARALQVFKEAAIETYSRNWVKTRLSELSSELQSAKSLQGFGRLLAGAVAPLCDAGVALFYESDPDNGRLRMLGGYGLPSGSAPDCEPGEGLLGQCALEKRVIEVNQIPKGWLRVQSASGEAPPNHLLVVPALVQDRLVGVLELAGFKPFSPRQRQLLDELMPVVALSLENLSSALRTHELLEESQTQAEELKASDEALRTQQEELRATNDELQVKTRSLQEQAERLRASEEELKVQAEELQSSNEELRQKSETLGAQRVALENLQRETAEKADALARASQYKSEFLANMSHELRTPLNSLLILSRSLADNETGNLDDEQIESARIIHDSGNNLLRLINDILDLSKVEAGKMEIVEDDLSLKAFTARLARNFRHVAKEKSLSFEIAVDDTLPPTFQSDGARLEQIMNNLLGNAFKFTREGGITLNIARASSEQAARVGLEPETALAFAVRDTGIGIPADKFNRVFQAFEQVDGTTSRQFGGTGLGLSIARGMAQLLGGDILMQSEAGKGSVFTVVIPQHSHSPRVQAEMIEPPAGDVTAVAPVVEEPRSSRPVPHAAAFMVEDDRPRLQTTDVADRATLILAIEDDPVFARVLVDMIRRKGFLALAAGDGESGLQLARQFRPTGILLDVMLPGMDGWAVLDQLKADVATRHIPVHFVSATEDEARGLGQGAVGFLTKPVSKESLGQAFDRLLHFAPGAPRRVLLVDDDGGSRAAVRRLISGADVNLVEVESGETALEALRESTFDCIILDLGLPGISGFDFLEQASRAGPVPPVVVYSGRELTREENLRLREYTDSIVIKGVRSPERLMDEVSLFLHSIHAGQPSAPTAAAHQPEKGLNGHTVLIVDDDMRNIFALSKALRGKGLQVVMAQDGHKALRQIEENSRIELVLMDIMMPGMDGYETMREIRKDPRHSRLPIIALTAKAMRGDREKCLEAGANDYLSKPIDIDKLLSLMRVYVGSRA